MVDSVLVACPTYRGKRYALVHYMESFEAFEYPNRDLLLVDNTGDEGKYAAWLEREFGVGVRHIEPEPEFEDTFLRAWEIITDYAVEHQYGWVLSLEQDVIAPPMLIDTLLNAATYIGAPFVTHTYPFHDGKDGYYQGLGCTLMATTMLARAMEYVKQPDTGTQGLVEGAIYAVAQRGTHISIQDLLPLAHLDGDGEFRQYKPITDPRIALI